MPPLFLPDDQYLRWPLLPSEAVYGKLKGDRIKALMKEVTAISQKSRDDGNQYWGRITGTPYDAETQQWALQHFRRIGLEQIRTQEFDLQPQWMPASWEGSVQGGGKTVKLEALFPIFGSRSPTWMWRSLCRTRVSRRWRAPLPRSSMKSTRSTSRT